MNKIVVIGGANVDILAKSNNSIISYDSNIGQVKVVCGGVAFNISNNMSKLNLPVCFISAFSYDNFSEMLINECQKNNLDISHAQRFNDYPSSSYVAILENDGDLNVGVCDNVILKQLSIEKIYPLLKQLDNSDVVVVDTNLEKEKIKDIIDHTSAHIYCDPISTTKAKKLDGLLSGLTMLKPNLIEAKTLSNNPSNDYLKQLEYFVKEGVKEIIISLGKDGLCATNGKEYYLVGGLECKEVSTTGAGDAFMAGYIYATIKQYDFIDRLIIGQICSCITIESIDTVSKELNEDVVLTRYQQVKDKVKVERLK